MTAAIVIRGLLDRVVLVAAIVAGGCVPSFIAQYRQRVGGRLDQVLQDLAPFEAIAQRNFNGDIFSLIAHHRASVDPTFRDEGAAIQAMVDAATWLREAVRALQTDVFGQFAWLMTHADAQLLRDTWTAWQPSLPLTADGVAFALVAGVAVWLGFLLIWLAVAAVLRRASSRPLSSARR
jgi:Protein of unknown function (DUF2937)